MKVHYGVENIEIKCPVVTIGSFDGVHLGHACVIQHLKEKASSIDGESVIISFEPHPREVLYPRNKNRNLNNTGREDYHSGKNMALII
ncbi:MAG: adenylyltransferase/cytidyltransferase family protein [Butyricimonas paravirosa]